MAFRFSNTLSYLVQFLEYRPERDLDEPETHEYILGRGGKEYHKGFFRFHIEVRERIIPLFKAVGTTFPLLDSPETSSQVELNKLHCSLVCSYIFVSVRTSAPFTISQNRFL